MDQNQNALILKMSGFMLCFQKLNFFCNSSNIKVDGNVFFI